MARTHARIKTEIWHNDDWRALSMPAQHLYFTLITDPELSYCGIADWRPKRLAGRAGAWLPEAVNIAAYELVAAHFIAICEDTEEALVRTFVRHDGVLQNAKLAVSAANAVGAVASNDLRAIVIAEMVKARKDNPDWAAWKADAVKSVLRRKATDITEIDPFGPDLAPALGRLMASETPTEDGDLAHD